MKINPKYPYALKLYDPNDSDFTVHHRASHPLFPKDDLIISTCKGYLCLTNWAVQAPLIEEDRAEQFEFSLPYLKWLLGVIARFKLTPSQGGYPPGIMYDIVQLDTENELYVFRGAHHNNHGLMRYALENRKRHSYIATDMSQRFDLYDVLLYEHGFMQVLLDIQKQYEDGQL